jgi:hypothetical protein
MSSVSRMMNGNPWKRPTRRGNQSVAYNPAMKTFMLRVRVTQEEREAWWKAARDAGMTCSEWVRKRCSNAGTDQAPILSENRPNVATLATNQTGSCPRCTRMGFTKECLPQCPNQRNSKRNHPATQG